MDTARQLSTIAKTQSIKVGVLYSLTGTTASSETALKDATLLAISELNSTGGILGQIIVPVIVDAASDPAIFAKQARHLLETEQVVTLFGGWTSAGRKAVIPVLERYNAQLWYPASYEGLECSKHIFYTGSCPNQQIEPAVNWLMQHHGKRFYLQGSNSLFTQAVNKIIETQLKQAGGEIVGAYYSSPEVQDFQGAIAEIKQLQPDVVFNTLTGTSNIPFYQQYQEAGINKTDIPIASVRITEEDLQQIGAAATGHYAIWSYFQNLDTPENHKFVKNFQAMYGAERSTNEAIASAYTQVYLWQQAVEAAQSFNPARVRVAAYGQAFNSPNGLVRIEPNHHVEKNFYIGRVLPTGQLKIVCNHDQPIKPLPWLGIEELDFKNSSEVSTGIDQNWQSKQKSTELEVVLAQLQTEIIEKQRIEKVLRKSEAELQALFAAMSDVVLIRDREGRCLKIAPTQPTNLYKSVAEMIGRTEHEIFPAAQADLFLGYIQQAIDTQQTINVEYSLAIADREVWFSASISPISSDAVVWIARDITEYKRVQETVQRSMSELERRVAERTSDLKAANTQLQAEILERNRIGEVLRKSEAELRALFTAMTDIIIVFDHDGRYLRVAPTNPQLLYKPVKELLGKTIHEVLPADLADNLLDCIKSALQKRRTFTTEYKLLINGVEVWFSASVSPLLEDQVVWVARNITEMKQVEVELQKAKELADEANKSRSSFLANMSHELRTPLNAIIGYSEVLQEEAEEWQQEDLIPDLQKICSAGRHLLGLINDILDLCRIEAGRVGLYLETFDITALVDETVSSIQPLLQKNNNEIVVYCAHDIGFMHSDLSKVRQSLLNLLSNACKFTHNGKIRLTVRKDNVVTVKDENVNSVAYIVISVTDTGIGMTPEQLQRLFLPFTQADSSSTRKYGGTGLGLAITQKLCQLMDGDIVVESDFGRGASFTIRLPAQMTDPKAKPNDSNVSA